MSGRYAIFWAPARRTALWRTGCQVLGRDAANGKALLQPELSGLDGGRFRELTEPPRLYGLHATLKPPFRLAPGASVDQLRECLEDFSAKRRPFGIPPLVLAPVGRFLALIPEDPCVELDLLARDCVEHFDRFRAPATLEELDKRRSKGLTCRQDALLAKWGYPYVMEEYRFHITLTGSIQDPAEREVCLRGLADVLAPGDPELEDDLAGVEIREICLYEQPGPGQSFSIVGRYPFGCNRG